MLRQSLIDDAPREPQARARASGSVMSSVINLASTCTGTGVLALPAAYHQAGFTAGCVLCIGAAAIQMASLHLLERSEELYRRSWVIAAPAVSFYSLCESAVPGSGRIIDCAILINCLGGGAISYLIVAGDCFSALGFLDRRACVMLSTVLVAPACFFRSLDSLKVTSTVSVVCLLLVGLLILVFSLRPVPWLDPCPAEAGEHCGATVTFGARSPLAVFCTLPLFINAFTCQQNFFNVLGELGTPTRARRTRVVVLAPVLPLCLYLTVASAGYLTWGHLVASNVINNYPKTPLIAAARAVLGVVVLCNVPLQVFPSRVSLTTLLGSCGLRAALPGAAPESPPPADDSFFLTSALDVRTLALTRRLPAATSPTRQVNP